MAFKTTDPRRLSVLIAVAAAGFALQAQALTDADRASAADQTAKSTSNTCKAIGKFYWEIGDKNQKLASGTKGLLPPGANSKFDIASASKWMFAAYVYKKRGNSLSSADIEALTMRTGYNNSASCLLTTTVGGCFNAGLGSNKNNLQNGTPDGSGSYKFYYSSGSFQKFAAVDLGLAADNNSALASEMQSYLGGDIAFSFVTPQPAGGVRTDATNYAIFLR